jgi:hypothetical protein
MPEVRTSLSIEVHRKLKGEAVNNGVYLKHFIAQILEEHVVAQILGEHSKDNKTNKLQRPTRGNLR